MQRKTNFDNLVVLLIDMQIKFIQKDIEKVEIIPNQISVLEFCIPKQIPVVVFEYIGNGRTIKEITDVLKNKPSERVYYLQKQYNDAFYNPTLSKILKSFATKTILIMGINAGFCVYETTKTAIKKGYQVTTSKDLIAGYKSPKEKSPCPCVSWYKKNTIFFDSHEKIIKKIK